MRCCASVFFVRQWRCKSGHRNQQMKQQKAPIESTADEGKIIAKREGDSSRTVATVSGRDRATIASAANHERRETRQASADASRERRDASCSLSDERRLADHVRGGSAAPLHSRVHRADRRRTRIELEDSRALRRRSSCIQRARMRFRHVWESRANDATLSMLRISRMRGVEARGPIKPTLMDQRVMSGPGNRCG